jgi:hypothetical protein
VNQRPSRHTSGGVARDVPIGAAVDSILFRDREVRADLRLKVVFVESDAPPSQP